MSSRSPTLRSVVSLAFALGCASPPAPSAAPPAPPPPAPPPPPPPAVHDDALASVGDACLDDGSETHACSLDHGALLVCRNGKYAKKRDCKGPGHCTVNEKPEHTKFVCDSAIADVGDACDEASLACTPDAKLKLRCQDGAFVADNSCRGPKGCVPKDNGTVDCDESIAMEGDACDAPGEFTCGMDGTTELVCTERRFVKRRDCKGTNGCSVRGAVLYCADK